MTGRDRSLDIFKGILVVGMVYCHVLQFFGDAFLFPQAKNIETVINLLIFPSFVFAFGRAVSIAYLPKPFSKCWGRMLKASLRALGAFYLSGIAFRVLRENKPFGAGTVSNVLLLRDIPGWSEFIVAFALYGLLAIALFAPLKKLKEQPVLAVLLSGLCLLCCFIPYGSITSPHLGLLIGTGSYVTFPVLQYAPYFLLGVAFSNQPNESNESNKSIWIWGAGAVLSTFIGLMIARHNGGVPERFPPSLGWILLPAAGVAALMLLAKALCMIPAGKIKHVDPLIPFESMGRNSLFYLLATNLALFTFAGKRIVPQLKRNGVLWGRPIQQPFGAFCWTVVLLLACGFCAWLIQNRRLNSEKKRTE